MLDARLTLMTVAGTGLRLFGFPSLYLSLSDYLTLHLSISCFMVTLGYEVMARKNKIKDILHPCADSQCQTLFFSACASTKQFVSPEYTNF